MESPINRSLQEIRFKSYYCKHQLTCKYIVVFFRFDNYWFKVVSGDGISEFEYTEEPEIITLDSFKEEEYAYPVSNYLGWERNNYRKLILVQECLWKGKSEASCGFLLKFEPDNYISIIDNDDCLSLIFQKEVEILKKCLLVNKFY
jgi:hypothetical protein